MNYINNIYVVVYYVRHKKVLVRRARALDMGLTEVRELVEWASTGSCNEFQERFQGVLHRKLEEMDQRIADLNHLKQDLQRLGAHFEVSQKEADADHTVLECSPETCACLRPRKRTRINNNR